MQPSAPAPQAATSASLREQYNALHYQSRPIETAYTPSIEAIGRLYCMRPAPAHRCRVLELACGEGINLISMALQFPDSEFVGVDLADEAVRRGRENIAALSLTNLQLTAADIMTMSEEWGQFDYILAHGFFSWVPEPVRQQILALTNRLLAPQGIAFISYNALPGGRQRQMVRDILLHHVRHIAEPRERIDAARAFARFLLQGFGDDERRSGARQEFEKVLERSDWSLYHDELAEFNQQFLFSEFAALAGQHGLQFLAEAHFGSSFHGQIPPMQNVLEREQYVDFAVLRRFRENLLCRAEVTLDRDHPASRLSGLFAMGNLIVPPVLDPASTDPVEFHLAKGGSIKSNHPLMKTVLQVIAQAYPQAVSVEQVENAVRALPDSYELTASAFLMQLLQASVISLYSGPFPLVAVPGERPRSGRLARLRLRHETMVPNLRHQTIKLEDEAAQQFVASLDGSRSQADLAAFWDISPDTLRERLQEIAKLGLLEA